MPGLEKFDLDKIKRQILARPHDAYFKYSLQDLELAKEFIQCYLPDYIKNQIDVNAVIPEKDSFIDEKLKEHYADMLFKTRLKINEECHIYCFFEHKSRQYRNTALQLLEYMLSIWKAKCQSQKKQQKLPVIIPIVIYHGNQAWSASTKLSELLSFIPNSFEEFVPDYRYLICDLSTEKLKGSTKLKLFVMALKTSI